jgi:LPS-assembly lipoprotein
MISTRSFKLLLLLLATTMLAACGFHPRNDYSLPLELKSVFLEGGSPALREQMRQQLRHSKGELSESLATSSMVIKIFDEQFKRRGVSLSERGKTNEFELIYNVEYELATPKDAILLARQPLEIRRDYYNDQQAVLARDNEEATLRSEMAQQIVRTLLNQARFTLEKSEK